MCSDKPHDVDCAEVLERVYVFLDHEMDEVDTEKVRHHLNECSPCLEKYDLEELVKQLVHRSCCSDKAPEELREKVLLRIRATHVEITTQTRN
jgi:mycothiol system anti-sigma-R factor